MSLDVYLTVKGDRKKRTGSGIFVRENGQTKEISREEWDERNPGHEPAIVELGPEETNQVYWRNITHNLNVMAEDAGIYAACWRPEDIGATKASHLIPILKEGLARLEANPQRFKAFNPDNGWGSYESLCEFVKDYLKACEEYPDADVHVSR